MFSILTIETFHNHIMMATVTSDKRSLSHHMQLWQNTVEIIMVMKVGRVFRWIGLDFRNDCENRTEIKILIKNANCTFMSIRFRHIYTHTDKLISTRRHLFEYDDCFDGIQWRSERGESTHTGINNNCFEQFLPSTLDVLRANLYINIPCWAKV